MHSTMITRVAERQWHAVEDDRVVGRGHTAHRPDGRLYLSIDTWQDAVFGRLAGAMLNDLPRPLYTLVDQADRDLTARWERTGFAARRHEWAYLVPTDPLVTGLESVPLPEDVTVTPIGTALEAPLRELYDAIHDEVDATIGWASMPAEVPVRPDGTGLDGTGPAGTGPYDPAPYAVAVQSGRYVGLIRVTGRARQPRIGLLAVRNARRRRGIARALLAHVLSSLHRSGAEAATAEVDEFNTAAVALLEGIGARRAGGNLEFVLH